MTPCFCSDFEPRYLDKTSISHLVVGSDVRLHAPGSISGELVRGRVDAYKISPQSSWNSTLAWTDVGAVMRIYSNPLTHYTDLKRIVMSNGIIGSRISLRLQIQREQSLIWLCELNLGLNYPPEYGRISTDASIYILYNAKPSQHKILAEGPEDQCTYYMHCFGFSVSA